MTDSGSRHGLHAPPRWWVNAAFLCERVIPGVGSELSVEQVRWETTPEPGQLLRRVTLVLSLTAEEPNGGALLVATVRPVTGGRSYVYRRRHDVGGEGRTLTVHEEIDLPVDEDGVLWVDVEVDGEVLTRIPHRVRLRVAGVLRSGAAPR